MALLTRDDLLCTRPSSSVGGWFGKLGEETLWGETKVKGVKATPLQPIALVCALLSAVTTQAGDTVAGYDNFSCMSTISFSFDSVVSACSDRGIKAYRLGSEGFDTCHVCDDDTPPTGPGIVLRPCPSGQHGHGLNCHADHVCGSNQIGGGAKDCKTCPDGQEPNAARTACVSSYQVARCSRDLDVNRAVRFLLPQHPNVVVDNGTSRTQRGFFPADQARADAEAMRYATRLGFTTPVFVPSVVREDPVEGVCTYESNVTATRYDTVEERMLRTVNTRPPWHEYHAFVRNSRDWATQVLQP